MPHLRAAQLKENLLALIELGNEQATRVVADLSPRTLRTIEHATRVDWLPIELGLELVHAIHAVAGEAGLRRWGRAALHRAVESSLLRPLVEAVSRLFGLSPETLLKAAPQAWKTVFRDCGVMTLEARQGAPVAITLRELPPALQDRAFLMALSGSVEAVFDLSRLEGQARLVEPLEGDEARIEVTWRAG